MKTFVAAALLSLSAAAFAEDAKPADAKPADAKPAAEAKGEKKAGKFGAVTPADLKWVAPPDAPPGVMMAPISGNPTKGPHAAFVKLPGGMKNPLHSHSPNLKQVIVSGTWIEGADEASAKEYPAGSYVFTPGGWTHYSACKEGADCIFFQEGNAAFDMKPAAAPAPAAK
jgi:hypothetical protein